MSRRDEQEPTVTEGAAHHDKDSRTYNHPAYGQLSASRVTGGTTLYGTDFEHHNFIAIRVKRSEFERTLSRDWHHAKDEIVELHISEAQWATFVSSLNVGEGVPCTLTYVGRKAMPGIPLRRQADDHKAELHQKVSAAVGLVDDAIADIEGELGASVSAKKKASFLGKLRGLRQQIASNLPFVAESFERHMDKVTEHAKIEVNAYAQNVIQRAGLAALGIAESPLKLGAGSSDIQTIDAVTAFREDFLEERQPDGTWVEVDVLAGGRKPGVAYRYSERHIEQSPDAGKRLTRGDSPCDQENDWHVFSVTATDASARCRCGHRLLGEYR